MKHIIVAPVGSNPKLLFAGIREFPTERVILLAPAERMEIAKSTANDLDRFNIPVQIKPVNGDHFESLFEAIADIKKREDNKSLLINVATGDARLQCAATAAAFVNGISAFTADDEGITLLPVLKFSYYQMLTNKKLEILSALREKNCRASLDQLSKKTGMSLPLISYHINGNLKSAGLKELRLVETREEKGRISVSLSSMGNLLMKGHIE